MKRRALLGLMVLIGVSGATSAASIDKALRKLGPEEIAPGLHLSRP
jgi:hypothetical protein